MPWSDLAAPYAAEGFAVFPLHGSALVDGVLRCTCGHDPTDPGHAHAKHPIGNLTPAGHNDATTNPATLEAWSQALEGVPANVGVAVPEGFAVVDVDPRNGGIEALETLQKHFGPLDPSRLTATGGGGWHYWFRVPADVQLPADLAPGVDIRQRGNYVVGAGSVHFSGGAYTWLRRGPTPNAPEWIVATGRERGALPEVVSGPGVDVPSEAIDALVDRLEPLGVPGQKHHLVWAVGSWLNGRGWSGAAIAECVRRLLERCTDVRDLAAGVQTALDGRRYVGGWSRISGWLGAVAPEVDRETPNPARVDVEEGSRVVAEAMAELLPTLTVAAIQPGGDVYFGLRLLGVEDPPPLVQLVQGLDISPGLTTILAAKPGASKTPFALALALCLGAGAPWLGREVLRRRALYLSYEKPIATQRKRTRIARALGIHPACVELIDMRKHPLTFGAMSDVLARLEAVLTVDAREAVIFLDTYGAAVTGAKHNDAEYAEPLRLVRDLVTDRGAAFVPLMHAKKGGGAKDRDDVEGSVHLVAAADAVIGLGQPDPADHTLVEVRSVRAAEDGFQPFAVRWTNVADAQGFDPRWGLTLVAAESPGLSALHAERRATKETRVGEAYDRIVAYVKADAGESIGRVFTLAELSAAARSDLTATLEGAKLAVKFGMIESEGGNGEQRYRVPIKYG